jgi:hypothetical protein
MEKKFIGDYKLRFKNKNKLYIIFAGLHSYVNLNFKASFVWFCPEIQL